MIPLTREEEAFDVTPPRPYRGTTFRERELTLYHIHTFLTTQGHRGSPRMRISSMPGPPPRQHEHERRYTSFTHPFILTRWIWKDDYDCLMIFVVLCGLIKLPEVYLTGEEKPRQNFTQDLSRSGIEPGSAAWQARMLPPVPQQWKDIIYPLDKYEKWL